MNDNFDIFDREIRAKLLSGVEPVPEGLWAGVQARRAVAARRAAAAVWWRRAAIGLSAAAAVAIGVFLSIRTAPTVPVSESSELAVTTSSTGILAENTTESAVPDTQNQVISEEKAVSVIVPETQLQVAANERAVSEVGTNTQSQVTAEETVPSAAETPNAGETSNVAKASNTDETEPIHVVPNDNNSSSLAQSLSDETVADNQGADFPVDIIPSEPFAKRSGGWAVTAGGNIQNRRVSSARSAAMRSAGNVDTGSRVNDLGATGFGIPVTFGIGVVKTFSFGLGVGTGINYSLLPRTFRGTYSPENGDTFEADIAEYQHFIGIPLNVYHDIVSSKTFSLHTFAGGQAEKLVSRSFRISPDTGAPVNYSEGAKGLQWSVGAGLGMGVRLTDHFGLYVDPGIRYYFNCGQPRSIRTLQPVMLNLEAGLRFDF